MLLLRLTRYIYIYEIIRITSVGFDVADQLLIRLFKFFKKWEYL
jgi:hypothetical protein